MLADEFCRGRWTTGARDESRAAALSSSHMGTDDWTSQREEDNSSPEAER